MTPTNKLTEEEAIARIEKLADDLMAYYEGCADARTWGGPTIYPKHPVDEARAYADAKALRRVIALRSEREEGERIAALEGALERVGELVRDAKEMVNRVAAVRRKVGPIATQAQSAAHYLAEAEKVIRKAQGSDNV